MWVALLSCLACLPLVLATGGSAVSRSFPVLPPDGAVVGPRPVFQLGYESLEDPNPRKLRFRIRLDPVRSASGSEELVFDQRKRRSGWLMGHPGHMIYRPHRPLPDGEYRWDVSFWNGVEWRQGGTKFEIRVDSIPPANVEGLRIEPRREGQELLLVWDPVTLDQAGGPEFVSRYYVYRFERRGLFRRVRSNQVAVVEQPRYVDQQPQAEGTRILYYRITAEDAAGNEGDLLE